MRGIQGSWVSSNVLVACSLYSYGIIYPKHIPTWHWEACSITIGGPVAPLLSTGSLFWGFKASLGTVEWNMRSYGTDLGISEIACRVVALFGKAVCLKAVFSVKTIRRRPQNGPAQTKRASAGLWHRAALLLHCTVGASTTSYVMLPHPCFAIVAYTSNRPQMICNCLGLYAAFRSGSSKFESSLILFLRPEL